MRPAPRLFAAALALATATVSFPALAQAKHEIMGKIVQIDLHGKHIVVEETRGRKYKQPLGFDAASKIELPSGDGTLAQLQVGDEVSVSYEASATGPEVVELQVTKAAGS